MTNAVYVQQNAEKRLYLKLYSDRAKANTKVKTFFDVYI